MYRLWVVCVLLTMSIIPAAGPTAAQDVEDLPRCENRPTIVLNPVLNPNRWCPEKLPIKEDGPRAFTRMVFDPDLTLYAIRTFTGELVRVVDTDGDYMQDQVEVLVDGLILPTGLDYADGGLYIVGGPNLYRYDIADAVLAVLVDDLPVGTGFWNGEIAVGQLDGASEARLFVGTGAPCDACVPDEPERGAILSFALDGTDRQLMATGLRNPAALAIFNGDLWTVDTAREGLGDSPGLDEVNRVQAGGHYGWPYCVGDNQPDTASETFSCDEALAPVVRFVTHSRPVSLAPYTSDTFSDLTGTLLVALGGSSTSEFNFRGYQLVSVLFDEQGQPQAIDQIVPLDSHALLPDAVPNPVPYTGYYDDWYLPKRIGYEGRGLWPHHVLEVAVHPAGWIYLSLSNGDILVIRPRPPVIPDPAD